MTPAKKLADECQALLEAGLSSLEGMSEAASRVETAEEITDHWWAMIYTLRQAKEVLDRLHLAVE